MQEFYELLARAHALPHCLQKVQVIEEAIRLADSEGSLELAFRARGELVKAASWIGRTPEALTAFTWQLGQADADPERFNETNLFFQYQWIISDCAGLPSTSKSEISAMLDDLESRLQRNDISLRSASHLRWRMAMRMGDLDQAVEEQQRWRTLRHDGFCFHHTCECDSEVELLIERKRDQEALVVAEPIIKGKYIWPQAVPEFAFGNLLVSCMRLGKPELAEDLHQRGWALVGDDFSQLFQNTRHLLYTVWARRWERARTIFLQQLPRYKESASISDHASFLWAAGLLLERLADSEPRMELPGASLPGLGIANDPFCNCSPVEDNSFVYDTQELAQSCLSEAMKIVQQFDERNGNEHLESTFLEDQHWCG